MAGVEDIQLWLVSNSNLEQHPENSLSNFTVELPRAIELDPALEWAIAVSDVILPSDPAYVPSPIGSPRSAGSNDPQLDFPALLSAASRSDLDELSRRVLSHADPLQLLSVITLDSLVSNADDKVLQHASDKLIPSSNVFVEKILNISQTDAAKIREKIIPQQSLVKLISNQPDALKETILNTVGLFSDSELQNFQKKVLQSPSTFFSNLDSQDWTAFRQSLMIGLEGLAQSEREKLTKLVSKTLGQYLSNATPADLNLLRAKTINALKSLSTQEKNDIFGANVSQSSNTPQTSKTFNILEELRNLNTQERAELQSILYPDSEIVTLTGRIVAEINKQGGNRLFSNVEAPSLTSILHVTTSEDKENLKKVLLEILNGFNDTEKSLFISNILKNYEVATRDLGYYLQQADTSSLDLLRTKILNELNTLTQAEKKTLQGNLVTLRDLIPTADAFTLSYLRGNLLQQVRQLNDTQVNEIKQILSVQADQPVMRSFREIYEENQSVFFAVVFPKKTNFKTVRDFHYSFFDNVDKTQAEHLLKVILVDINSFKSTPPDGMVLFRPHVTVKTKTGETLGLPKGVYLTTLGVLTDFKQHATSAKAWRDFLEEWEDVARKHMTKGARRRRATEAVKNRRRAQKQPVTENIGEIKVLKRRREAELVEAPRVKRQAVAKEDSPIFVNVDLADSSVCGNQLVKILRVLPPPHVAMYHDFHGRIYVPLEKTSFRRVRIGLTNKEGQLYNFPPSASPTVIGLHLKATRQAP